MICIRVVGGLTRRSLAVGLLSVTAALAGCKGSSEPLGPTATVPQATTTTNPYAVPAVIDVAYVNRVLAGMDQAVGDVTRLIVTSQSIPPEAIDRLRAIYSSEDWLQLMIDSYQKDQMEKFMSYREVPGDQKTLVRDLISTSVSCIFAEVSRDFSAVSSRPATPPSIEWIAIRALDEATAYTGQNSTGWAFIFDGFLRDRVQPPDPCAAA
jgi:hypothetical protein